MKLQDKIAEQHKSGDRPDPEVRPEELEKEWMPSL
jgi:hypothetical protein